MKKLLGLALLTVMGSIITSCRDDADRRRAYVENNTQDTLMLYTKGSVLLVCLRCVDTLVFVSKHAEGISLCCDVPSLIVAGMNHRISSRFTRIQQEDYLWKFVLIRG